MEPNLKEITIKIRNKEKENFTGQTEMFIKEILKLINVKVKAQ